MKKTNRYVGRLERVSPCWLRGNRHPRFDAAQSYPASGKIPVKNGACLISHPHEAWTGLGKHVDIRI